MGCAFAAMIVWTAIAASSIAVLSFHARQAMWLVPIAILIVTFVVGAFVLTMRRTRGFFGEQDRLRRQLMADVAHELRTPIAILQGRIEGLIDGVYPRDDAHLTELLDETQHLARLVDDVRTVANAEAGALALKVERVEVGELVRDAARAVDPKIGVDVANDLPPIEADPLRIREVLLNLLTNAVEHAPEGRVSIGAERGAGSVIIRVRDDGPGIAPEDLPHLFERFHKGAHSRCTGLGLSIARRLVVAHGGTIRVDSAQGVGTTVTVSLRSG